MATATAIADLPASAQEASGDDDAQLVLDYLLAHKKVFTQDFLRQQQLYFSGSKSFLRQRLQDYLATEQVKLPALVALLNRIEGWGNQHIYLYQTPGRLIEPWLQEFSVRQRLRSLQLHGLLNRPRPLILPPQRSLASIEWTPARLRLVWVEKRQWEERLASADIVEGDTVWRAYRTHATRGLVAFDWDLLSGQAMLMIQQLPSGANYRGIRGQLEAELEPIVAVSQFERLRVSRAIAAVTASNEARRRQLMLQTRRGSRASFISADRHRDAFADPQIEQAGSAFAENVAGLLGNYYWPPAPGELQHEVHIKIYAQDQRVAIFGEHTERDVRYVLSRIRHYCS